MINIKNIFFSEVRKIKNYKNILLSNKIIKSVLFLRYIFLIFITVFLIYLLIPKFFDEGKRYNYVKELLLENYDIKLENPSKITYKILPTPKIIIENLNFNTSFINGNVKYLELFLNLSQLYNYEYLKLRKISINESNLFLKVDEIENFAVYLKNLKNKIFINKSNLSVFDQDYQVINVQDIKFNNKKSENLVVTGYVFNKKFNMKLKKIINKNILFFNIPTIGLNSKIEFKNTGNLNSFEGDTQLRILDNNFQFSFKKIEKKIIIFNSFFRNNILQTTFDNNILIKPFFNFDLILNIKNINFKKINFEQISKSINKLYILNPKLNGKLKINYQNNSIKSSFNNKIIDEVNFEILFQNKDILIKTGKISADKMNLSISGIFKDNDNFKVFNFNIFSSLDDINYILKKFKIKRKQNNALAKINVEGFLNLTSNKIKFNQIKINNKKISKKEELDYYEIQFEDLIIKNNVLNIFNKEKIKKFIEEIN
jgi:hypothetical protein